MIRRPVGSALAALLVLAALIQGQGARVDPLDPPVWDREGILVVNGVVNATSARILAEHLGPGPSQLYHVQVWASSSPRGQEGTVSPLGSLSLQLVNRPRVSRDFLSRRALQAVDCVPRRPCN
jgi:hypothetical protein